jgi:hypothetical protein
MKTFKIEIEQREFTASFTRDYFIEVQATSKEEAIKKAKIELISRKTVDRVSEN